MLDATKQDLRYAVRQVRRSPLLAGTVVIVLALGIGATTAVFGFVDALLFRPFPGVETPDRLAAVQTVYDGEPTTSSYMDLLDFRREAGTFRSMAGFKPVGADLGVSGETLRVRATLVTAEYFEVLGVRPAVGRFFRADEDDAAGGNPYAVLAHGLWERRFGGDPGVVGRAIRVNGRPFRVVGVAPRRFRGTRLQGSPDLFVPMSMQPVFMPASGNLLENRGWGGIQIVGRLAEDVPLSRADAEIRAIGARLEAAHPRTNRGRGFAVESFGEARLPHDMRATVFGASWVLAAAVLAVLLVACANVANLMLARGLRHRRDAALRRTLGATAKRLVRQHLTESALLSLAGSAAGLLVGRWILHALGTAPLPFELDLSLDGRVLAFTAGVALLTGIGFGLVPALAARRTDLVGVLREERGVSPAGRRRGFAAGLVVAQVALSVPLLAGAGLLGRTLRNLGAAELGFRPAGVAVAAVDPTLEDYAGPRLRAYYEAVLEEVRALPGVEAASIASQLPGPGGDAVNATFEEEPEGRTDRRTGIVLIGRDYFRVMGIPLLAGRAFDERDGAEGPSVFVMNRSAAESYRRLTGRDPLDARVGFEGQGGPFFDVVGVVADARMESLREPPGPFLYALHAQAPAGSLGAEMSVLVRTTGSPSDVLGSLRRAIRNVDADVPVIRSTTLASAVDQALATERILGGVIAGTGVLAVLLAAAGLYGLLAYLVSRRTGEIGVRMALGARAGDVLRGILARGMVLVGSGLAVGVLLALVTTRWLSGFLYGVSPGDPLTLAVAGGVLAVVGLVASWLPAHRAAAVDPLTALRYE